MTPAPFKVPAVDPEVQDAGVHGGSQRPECRSPPLPGPQVPDPAARHLKNGTQVILAERHDIPVVQMSYEFRGGSAADPAGAASASFAMACSTKAPATSMRWPSPTAWNRWAPTWAPAPALDSQSAYLSALKQNLEPSVALYADMLRKPRFDQAEIDRVKGQWIAGIKQGEGEPERHHPARVPGLVFGAGHPYAAPPHRQRHRGPRSPRSPATTWWATTPAPLRPQAATLVVVGDTTLKEIVPVLERHFGDWQATGSAAAAATIPAVAGQKAARVFLVDQPGAVQLTSSPPSWRRRARIPASTAFDMGQHGAGRRLHRALST